MALVASHGAFPPYCPTCTGLLPQWQPLDVPCAAEAIA